MDWLKWTLLEAQNYTRRSTWVPIKPDELLKLSQNRQMRFIQNGEQLLDYILESLNRLEQKLQGETPAAIDLWNFVKRKYTPKDENNFSDYVKRHLEEDLKNRGIVVNREVEIRRGQSSSSGERTDILVDAVIIGKEGTLIDVITVIIEAKGCWHKEVLTAMKTQLVDRYLKENQCRHGLFLVGWFNCEQWDKDDYRFNEASKHSLEKLRRDLSRQAQELSDQGLVIRSSVIKSSLR